MKRIALSGIISALLASTIWLASSFQELAPQAASRTGQIDEILVLRLIRTTLVALGQANITGNYTVFRDLAAPSFRDANNASQLSEIFANVQNRAPDLDAVAVVNPTITVHPYIDNQNLLRVAGYFPTRPLQFQFDLVYQQVAEQWRLIAITVNTPEATPVAQAPTKP